jgi:hypothetical protein
MAPPSVAPPVVAPSVPTINTAQTAAPSTIPTPTVAPTPMATAPSAVPTNQPTTGGGSTTTTPGAQLPRARPPTTKERHPKRVATEAAATLQRPQLTAGGGPAGPAASTVSPGGAQADQRWEQARAEVQRLWTLGQQLQTEAQTKPTYTGFRETAKMAQDTFEAAEAASRQAREERMASVGALPMTGLQLPGAPVVLEPLEQLEADCQDQVQALAVEIVNRGAAARAAVQGVQRPEGETGASAGRGTTQPGTMLPPPAPLRTVVAPATAAGQQLTRGPGGPGLGPATATRPGRATVTGSKPRRPQGLGPPAGPTPVTRSSSRVEFNAQMSRKDILRALKQLLPNQFKQPPEVAAEFAEGYVAPAEDADRTIAGRILERILTNEDLDVGFSMDRETAMHNLRGLWRRLRREEHERQPPHARPGLRQPPLPVPESEEYLDAQGLEPIGLEGEALGDYLAQLEEAVRTWWKTVGPADNLPYQVGRLVDPSGPADGERWPSDNLLTSQVQTLWALERAKRTFAEGLDVAEPARLCLTGERVLRFSGLHDSPQRATDDRGRCVRYVSLETPVDSTPKPPDRGTHLTLPDDTAVLPDLPHLQPKEMREMEMVLRSYWQAAAREPNGDERFKGPPPEELQALGFQAEELAGRVSRWERMESHLGRDRTVVDRAIQRRDDLWKEAFTDFNLDPPKPHTELVTKQGNRVYVVKWTPELARPQPTQGAAGDQPSGDAEEGPPLIWTRVPLPGAGPLGRAQIGGPATGRGREETAVSGAETGPTNSQAPTAAAGQVTVRQVLNESLAQATQ